MAAELNPSPPQCEENRGGSLLVLSYTLVSIAIITVVLRVWFRRSLRNGISWDDYFIVASLVSSFLFKPDPETDIQIFCLTLVLSGIGWGWLGLDWWHHRRRLSYKDDRFWGWSTYILFTAYEHTGCAEMEHLRPDRQYLGDWACQDIRVPMYTEGHRQSREGALTISLRYYCFRFSQPLRSGGWKTWRFPFVFYWLY